MKGRRLPDGFGPDGRNPALAEGDYWKDADGLWWLRPPGGHMSTLGGHTVEEHEDGTITVSPSLQQDSVKREGKPDIPGYHGFLRRGMWEP